jgi:transcription regulator MmyB-like protein
VRVPWAAHDVRFHHTGVKRLHHPVVGDRELTYEVMDLSADTGLTTFAYTPEAGSKSERDADCGRWSSTFSRDIAC